MKFTTESGSTYELTDIDETDSGYTATLAREGVPLVEFATGADMGQLPTQTVYFAALPTVGASFGYSTSTHAWCLSTPVAEVTE